jgi:hypothetical protein
VSANGRHPSARCRSSSSSGTCTDPAAATSPRHPESPTMGGAWRSILRRRRCKESSTRSVRPPAGPSANANAGLNCRPGLPSTSRQPGGDSPRAGHRDPHGRRGLMARAALPRAGAGSDDHVGSDHTGARVRDWRGSDARVAAQVARCWQKYEASQPTLDVAPLLTPQGEYDPPLHMPAAFAGELPGGCAGLAGLIRGAYRYARPRSGRTRYEEAAWFCQRMAKLGAIGHAVGEWPLQMRNRGYTKLAPDGGYGPWAASWGPA